MEDIGQQCIKKHNLFFLGLYQKINDNVDLYSSPKMAFFSNTNVYLFAESERSP